MEHVYNYSLIYAAISSILFHARYVVHLSMTHEKLQNKPFFIHDFIDVHPNVQAIIITDTLLFEP